jgi:pimeloyl-ACP methyl ester carboxylesterase
MLAYSDSGIGNPVVLLHGIPGSQHSWDAVVPLLSSSRVLVPDLLGFGRSPDGTPNVHAFEQAEAVLAMLDHAGIRSAQLVGFDFGGPVAVAAHRLAPGRVEALTLIASNLLTDTPVPLPLRVAQLPVAGELVFRLMFSPVGLAGLWRQATVDRAAFPFAVFRAGLDARGIATTRAIFLRSLRQMSALYGPIESELPRIGVPVTIVWGDRDPFFPIAAGERTAGRFRAARWVLVKNSGHFLPQEKPAKVAAAITMRPS